MTDSCQQIQGQSKALYTGRMSWSSVRFPQTVTLFKVKEFFFLEYSSLLVFEPWLPVATENMGRELRTCGYAAAYRSLHTTVV